MATPEGYALIETLREDGETTLYRARKSSDESRVLLLSSKRAAPTLIARLEREYALRTELDPRWSAKPLALLRREGTVTLVLEDSGGMPLNVAAFGPHRMAERLDVAIGLAVALKQVHERGLIHKDIKPANVLMNRATGEVHLTGFGIATHLPRERQAPEPPEAIAGTLAYMAPEQTGRMNRSIDSRSDLYSLGMTLYEVFTGAQPFTASEPMAWIHCHVARLPIPPAERNRGIPGQLSAVIMKLLAKTPEDRYQTAAGLAADLRRCLADWQGKGQIVPFALAEHDLSTRLLIPEKLYGRERERAALLAAWERVVSNGAPELLLVSGYSGVGKSSLVNELHKSIVLPRGLFASGKFDQHKRGIPYATLAQAFGGLVQQILVEPEETVARYRATIQKAVGPNGQLIVDLVPELEFVIGKQEAVVVLPSQESKNRCHAVLTRFLGVFARREHPLALFLDDLQWLDQASLNLLEHILSSSEVRHLLLIGAYRDNEVSPSHPLMLTLDPIRRSAPPVHDIVLAPLAADDIAELVADAVHRSREEVRPLARLVYEKTAGNPFFTIQFLAALHDEALLRLVGERWEWDLERIRTTDFTDNVVELMIGKLGRLSAATQGALKVLACLGHRVETAVLGRVLGQGAAETQAALWDAIVVGLVVIAGNGYGFAHDRIQEAAYSLIPEQERAAEHLRIGRLLSLGRPEQEVEEAIFELVNHFNRGLELVTDASEKDLIRRLNFRAGRRAKAANAYASARTYLTQAMALLSPNAWSQQYDETFELIFDASECEYLLGNFARADDLLNLILARARSHPDRAKVYRLRATLFQVAGRYQDALRAGLEGLEPFGIVAPESADALQAAFSPELEEFSLNLHGRRIADLVDAKVATDAEARAVIGLIAEISVPLYSTRSPLFPWLILKSANTALRFGNTEDSCLSYIFLAILRIGLFDDILAGFELSEMALRLNEKFHDEKLRGTLLFIHALVVHSWRRPFATSLPIAERGLVASLNVGDLVHANLNAYALVWQTVMAGKTIDEASEVSRKALALALESHNETIYQMIRNEQQFLACLKGLTRGPTSFDDDDFNEAESVVLIERSGLRAGIAYRLVLKQAAAVICERYDEALTYARQPATILNEPVGSSFESGHNFYYALALTGAYLEAPPLERAEFAATLGVIQRKLRLWAENCPENFGCMEALVGAEVARVENRELDAMRSYERAIASACENGLIYVEGLACEAAAKFYLGRGIERSAYAYLRDARAAYLRWGALGKVKQLDQRYPAIEKHLLTSTSTIGTTAEQLDLPVVIAASQAVSGEIVPKRLIEKLLTIVLAQAGAQRCVLLLPREAELLIRAEATTSGEGIEVAFTQRLPSPDDLPESVLRYVVRTKKRVVQGDASTGSMFSADEYVKRKGSRSILCLPLIKQTTLVGVLYLENNLTSVAFTSDRVAMLEVLSSQAAISLENARLYAELVDERGRLRVSEERFATAFNHSPTPMAITRAKDDAFVDVNERFSHTFGYSREEFIGRSSLELGLATPEQIERAQKLVSETGSLHDVEFVAKTKSGEPMTLLASIQSIELGGESCLLTTFIDVTERKQVEAQLRQSQKMEAIGSLAGGIAHDFNNLLTVINGYSELASIGMKASDPNFELCQSILHAGQRAAGLTRKLLSFSRKEAGEAKEWNLNTIVLEMELMLGRLIEKDIMLFAQLAPDGVTIHADRSQVEQVILNLVVNARDAMPDGGRITIQTHSVTLEQSSVARDYVMLVVEDTGVGMTPEVKARLFEPFFTTKEAGKGTGLGLSVVHGIVKQSSGHISVSSKPGAGSTFRVSFPRAAEAVKASAPEKAAVLSGNERVLVAEDEGGIRRFVTQALELHGYRVFAAENGREALRLLVDSVERIDIVVSDIVMPDMGGRELAERIASEFPAVPILFISGYSTDLDVRRWVKASRVDFLPKPFSATDLAKKLREVLDQVRTKASAE